MSFKALAWALEQRTGSAAAKLVLIKLAENANDKTDLCWPSIETIVRHTELSDRTVQRVIKQLEEQGLISVQPTFVDGKQRTNAYKMLIGRGDTMTGLGVTPTTRRGDTDDKIGVTPCHPEPLEEPSKRTKVASLPSFDLPLWLDNETWESFVEHRKKIRKPLTEQAAKLIIAKLDALRAANDPRAVLNESIANGWTGVFALKSQSKFGQRVATYAPQLEALDEWITALRNWFEGAKFKDEYEIDREIRPKSTWPVKLGPPPSSPGFAASAQVLDAYRSDRRKRGIVPIDVSVASEHGAGTRS